ncbi:lipoprotein [Asanoa ishikariensis]|uniref:Putative aldouronate transport system substrate-binding protein n=1 Tax=Asanoa ishikariensis TaxID=137265 RepID=A0A1H3T0C6_9ACTN|nr:extracellular solute-binding protein [Asanoa ishikariensis]GIF63221.1 lipoprotein [Asanoa ishikariensis]SDZ43271.1 putative aldouronate transport system substrate-binding protein [Asanoa ishikariensis]
MKVDTGATTSRRAFLGLVGISATAGLLGGCGDKAAPGGATQKLDALAGVLPEQGALPAGIPKPDVISTRPVADGYTRFPSALVDAISQQPGAGGKPVTAMTPAWGPAPPSGANNNYLTAINAKLGTPVEFSVQDGNTYAEKLGAILGARDVPDLLCVPGWEVAKLARFSDAVKALFEDLTPFLSGAAVKAYPMLATLPTGAWRNACWNGRLMAVPNPTDNPFPYTLFYRKDLLKGPAPTSIDELYATGKAVTDARKGVWAFDNIFAMVQMFHKAPGSKDGWRRRSDGTPEFKYETPEFRQAAEFMAKLYAEGLVHPDVVASRGADAKQLLQSGKILFKQDGMGMWQPMQAEQQNVTPGFEVAPVPLFAVGGGSPLAWGDDEPISYTFVKKGLGKERVEELLRLVNWCSAPFGTNEYNLREFGVEGKQHTRGPDGPVKTDLGFKEIQNQYFFISGRTPVVQPTPQTPKYVPDMLAYANASVAHLEKDPWDGLKFEMPAKYKAGLVPSDDQINDILRGRRPLADLDAVVKEWRANGGDEARDLLGKALADNGR